MRRRCARRVPSTARRWQGSMADPPAPRSDRRPTPPPSPRGTRPRTPEPSRFRATSRWVMFALALLFLNFYLGSLATEPASRVRVQYSPFFLKQVTSDHVKEITSKGTAIQGTFTQKL